MSQKLRRKKVLWQLVKSKDSKDKIDLLSDELEFAGAGHLLDLALA